MMEIVERLWKLWPEQGRRRTQGWKPNSRRPVGLSPKERCAAALELIGDDTDIEHVIKAAEVFVKNTEERFVMGLERWLEEKRWQNENVNEHPPIIQPARTERSFLDTASGSVKTMLERMAEQGCPQDVLDRLAGNIGVTNCNRDRGIPATAVYKEIGAADLWHRAASGFAKRAGFNDTIYSKAYVEYVQARKSGL